MQTSLKLASYRPHLLIVDDDPDMVELLEDILERTGAVIKTAHSGTEALQRIAENDGFTLVVTDVCMPAPSGIQLAAMTRYAGYEIPFVIITALEDERIDATVSQLDRTVLLPKPFTPAALLRVCEHLMGAPSAPSAGLRPRSRSVDEPAVQLDAKRAVG